MSSIVDRIARRVSGKCDCWCHEQDTTPPKRPFVVIGEPVGAGGKPRAIADMDPAVATADSSALLIELPQEEVLYYRP